MNAKTESPKQVRSESDRPQPARRRNFGGPRLKLYAEEIPGYHQCWFNDEGSNVMDAQESGYDFVLNEGQESNDLGGKIRRLVGKGENGNPLYAYLMKIKNEWFSEDQLQNLKHCDMVDAAIKSGKPAGQDGSKFYDRGTKMETK